MKQTFEIYAAEVLEVIYSDANPNLIYGIKTKPMDKTPYGDSSNITAITAKPLNINVVRIPVVGEIVLLIKAPSSYATSVRNTTDTYYLDIVSMQSSIHHNSLPTATASKVNKSSASGNSQKYSEASAGNTQKESEAKVDDNFSESDTVKAIQHYVGDVIINGRYGQSIRFSTTPKSGNFKVSPKWSKGPSAAPISIYRNTYQTKDTKKINDFTTEDFTKEDNVIVQSSGQEIEFEQASQQTTAIKAADITSWQEENWGQTPQTLISAGRLVFNSSQKEIIAFAKSGIGLSSETNIAMDAADTITLSAPAVELGTSQDSDLHPLMLGDKWKSWMSDFITYLGTITVITPMGPAAPITSAPQWAQIEALKAQLDTLLSQTTKTK